MRTAPLVTLAATAVACFAAAAFAEPFATTYRADSVESDRLRIVIAPLDDDVLFKVSLSDAESGASASHEFQGEGANDPSPFLLRERIYCGAPTILLSVEYPFRHALPQYSLPIETFAFRGDDLSFIDSVIAAPTDIALLEDAAYGAEDMAMLPPVGVRCAEDPAQGPFEFFRRDEG